MRKGEITPELIELSKKAKELGFPQEVDEGDWTYLETDAFGENLILVTAIHNKALCDKEFLILSFSRCLEWFVKRSWILRLSYQKDVMKKDVEFSEWFDGELTKQEVFIRGYLFMENPDLWVAKAVVKILEEKIDSKK